MAIPSCQTRAMGERPAVVMERRRMREVEVKFQIRDPEALLAALKTRSIPVGDSVHQDDQAYAPLGWRFGDDKLGVTFLRLRTTEGRHTFTLKQPAENAQSCIEHETEIADRDQMHQAILAMGFYPTVKIAKTRRTATVGGIEICIDELESVGWFLELERMIPASSSAVRVQRELAEFVADLGVEGERISETYDTLVHAALGRQTFSAGS
jgi:adenylate cyclase class 2